MRYILGVSIPTAENYVRDENNILKREEYE